MTECLTHCDNKLTITDRVGNRSMHFQVITATV
jgi:hypothetical protein